MRKRARKVANFTLPDALADKVRLIADRTGLTMSIIVQDELQAYFEGRESVDPIERLDGVVAGLCDRVAALERRVA